VIFFLAYASCWRIVGIVNTHTNIIQEELSDGSTVYNVRVTVDDRYPNEDTAVFNCVNEKAAMAFARELDALIARFTVN
jgi:hypothetical protein